MYCIIISCHPNIQNCDKIKKRTKSYSRYSVDLKRKIAKSYLAGEASYHILAEENGLKNKDVVKEFVRWYQSSDYHQLHYQFKKLSKSLKKIIKEKLNLELDKLSQLRQSRIVIWVKSEGLRQAQHKAGFRRVLSAERYRKADLTDLKEQLKNHHPLKQLLL